MKHYNAMIDRKNFFDKPVRHKLITPNSIKKIVTIQGYGYTTDYLLDYNYFKNYCKIETIDLTTTIFCFNIKSPNITF